MKWMIAIQTVADLQLCMNVPMKSQASLNVVIYSHAVIFKCIGILSSDPGKDHATPSIL